MAEHAEAGAHREPPPPGRGAAAARAARAPPTTTSHVIERRRAGKARTLPSALDTRRSSCSSCIASASTVCACRRSARRSTSTWRAQETTAEDGDSQRTPAPGGGAGVGGQCRHEPAPVLDARLERVRRVGQPGRTGPAARSGRRVRAHGLPEPRSPAPGGRRARRAERRGAGAGRLAGRSKARAQAAATGSPADRAAHVGYHLVDRGRRDLEADVAYRPRFGSGSDGCLFASRRPPLYLGSDRDGDGAVARVGIGVRARHERDARRSRSSSRCCCCSRRPTSRSRSSSVAVALGAAAAAAAARFRNGVPADTPARWSSCRRC